MTVLPEFWEALELARGMDASASNIERVGKSTSADAARWAFTQWDLRKRAKVKFERAEEMLFTREALEQSTGEVVARYHASAFPDGSLVADLTCGIGGDLIALAQRGPSVGYETDPERTTYARHNVSVYGLDAEIRESSCLEGEWAFDYAMADPARRVGGRRSIDPDDFAPNPVVLAEKMAGLKLGLIKLSPMLRDDFLESFGGVLEFVSFGGECREALVWLGRELGSLTRPSSVRDAYRPSPSRGGGLQTPDEISSPRGGGSVNEENAGGVANPTRFAVHLESGERLSADPLPPPTVDTPSTHLYEADPAAIRAHCLNTLCEMHGLRGLSETNGYLTGEAVIESPWLRGWEVVAEPLPDLKLVKQELERLGSGTPVVKARGVDIDPAEVQKKLRLKGKPAYTVFIHTVGKKVRYIIASSHRC
ncbi:MAG: hypothetical protein KF784_03750 [Fimbriimonadaceae bacterium]|nr:hypothetical protein [Fimbriimonadaceae bacterium]